jgi:glycosyltransferase involved in cell wall biosynthesis
MTTVNIVVPPLDSRVFSGGIYCVLRHAAGLKALGCDVNIVPLLPSPRPQWLAEDFGSMPDGSARANLRRVLVEFGRLLGLPGMKEPKMKSRVVKQRLTNAIGYCMPRNFSPLMQRALQIAYVADNLPPANVTIATSFDTALAVCLYGSGRKFYFGQHYEPFFAIDLPDPILSEMEARLSYHLGLKMIANSSWLRQRLIDVEGLDDAELCPNAIDLNVFSGEPKTLGEPDQISLISYGGRNATWKGFADMAHGVRLARARSKSLQLRWQVYGAALLPPDNNVAEYEHLGFLQLPQLAQAYRQADILLSASWYESFPLFPLEAMACGLPVITTQFGTEEYAQHGETAEIVEPRNPEQIADAILKLANDADYRHRLAVNGYRKAQEFSWQAASKKMASIVCAAED